MTRRIVRTIVKAASAATVLFLVIFLLDRNFRVLPGAIHHYMPQHHAGLVITDVTLTKCSSVNPFSSCQLDEQLWHKIDKDLFLGRALATSAYVHIARKREEDLTAEDSVVMDVKVGRLNPSASIEGEANEKWEARPNGLWIKRTQKRSASDSKKAITALDVLFGDDAVEARPGWDIVGTPLMLDAGPSIPSAHITVRRGSQPELPKVQPRVRDNGKFKIVQLADLHLADGLGKCREAIPDSYNGGKCEADPRTLDFVIKTLDEEKPDMVVLSGDQVNGGTAPDPQSPIFKFAHILIERKIPYVCIFGNHDDERSTSRESQMALLETLPYSLSAAGPEDIAGIGNYYIEVLAPSGSKHSALTVYLLDTHSYSPDERKYRGYDWVKPNQIEWFRDTAQGLKKKHKEYTHIHLDVAFIHIPLPEIRDQRAFIKGNWIEGPTAPLYNSGFHQALVDEGVVMVSCGHDHVNEYCALSYTKDEENPQPALWECYAGGAGFGGYAGYGGFDRKIRMFDFDLNLGRITTWKRSESGKLVGKRIDEQIIVDGGRAAPPPQEDLDAIAAAEKEAAEKGIKLPPPYRPI